MDSFPLFFSTFFIFFLLPHMASGAIVCEPSFCGSSKEGMQVSFPFRLEGSQAADCGFPGFDLSCNNRSQTILNLPSSGDFVVERIDYSRQVIFVNDPDDCLFKRLLQNFTLDDSPFWFLTAQNFSFFNCSSNVTLRYVYGKIIPCASGDNYNIWFTLSDYSQTSMIPASCQLISSRLLPVSRLGWLLLTWAEPNCGECVARGGDCARKDASSLEFECLNLPSSSGGGVPRSVKYGITIGLGIPGLLCLVGLSCYLCGRVRVRRREPQPDAELSSMIIPHRSVLAMGLDRPTIESFPKTLLGASRRLPNPSDNTCPICLSEYQPKEELRTIPECNHYFHANCIDEWLKLNATCPLCRKSPDESSSVTSSSSRTSSATASLPTP